MIKTKTTTVTWHMYDGSPESLPEAFIPILVKLTDGPDDHVIGVFPGYRAPASVWISHNLTGGAWPMSRGDWWAQYPESPI